jgi:hypothetical protein
MTGAAAVTTPNIVTAPAKLPEVAKELCSVRTCGARGEGKATEALLGNQVNANDQPGLLDRSSPQSAIHEFTEQMPDQNVTVQLELHANPGKSYHLPWLIELLLNG